MNVRPILAEYLEYLRDSGVQEQWGPGGPSLTKKEKSAEAAQPLLRLGSLEEVREYLGECTRCKLHAGRTNIVFGVGNPNAKLVFVGEGPGRDEDLQGEPFVGRAGQLLTDIIEKGMKIKRSDVYIANIVKCRPPDNRDPESDEIASCEPFLRYQLAVIKPKIICALGKFAAQTLLRTNAPISAIRGKVFDYEGIKLIPTFHPAYLLRNPDDKKLVWEDVKKIIAIFNED